MAPLATVGILSIGDMGMGIAKLLLDSEYRVVTSVEGRSEDTKARATSASIEALPSDSALVIESDYIISIVPPRDAFAIAQRIHSAISSLPEPKDTPLYYLDFNAIAPMTARSIASLFSDSKNIIMVDGGIIGAPPSRNNVSDTEEKPPGSSSISDLWKRPSIPISGPAKLVDVPISGAHLAATLNVKHISDDIGSASGLKCCFATMSKGATALCIQAFTTASRMGVLAELEQEMGVRNPVMLKFAQSMTAVPPKAYRWVREMEEIAMTHAEDGGFEGGEGLGVGHGIFDAVAELYKSVAEDPILGAEKTESRKRGITTDDVAECMAEGLAKKQKKSA